MQSTQLAVVATYRLRSREGTRVQASARQRDIIYLDELTRALASEWDA
jgi:hypothetical protein